MTGVLVFLLFTLTVGLLGGYTFFAPWWTRRAGRAYFLLFVSLAVLSGHFLIEEMIGQSPQWVEDSALGFVALAVAWNLWTIISKQVWYWRQHPPVYPDGPTKAVPSNDPADPII